MKTVWNAFAFAVKAHDKTPPRRGGEPSILHPIRVALSVANKSLNMDSECWHTQAALLHDVVEDTDTTLKDLKKYGFGGHVTTLVNVLTRKKDQTYVKYIENIVNFDMNSPFGGACFLKTLDIEDNYPTATASMMKRYDKALKLLNPDPIYTESTRYN